MWREDELEVQMERFRHTPELDFCVSYAQSFWVDDLEAEAEYFRDSPRSQPAAGWATTTLLARARVFSVVGALNTSLWMGDATDWYLRAREARLKYELVEEVLTYHRMHPGNIGRRRNQQSRDEFIDIVKAALDRKRIAGKA